MLNTRMIQSPNFASITYSLPQLAQMDTALWFCVRTQPKHEHIAAAGLQRRLNVNCFAPRLRYRKMTRRGAVWFVEAMFPGYLFAEFVYLEQRRRVEYSREFKASFNSATTLPPSTQGPSRHCRNKQVRKISLRSILKLRLANRSESLKDLYKGWKRLLRECCRPGSEFECSWNCSADRWKRKFPVRKLCR